MVLCGSVNTVAINYISTKLNWTKLLNAHILYWKWFVLLFHNARSKLCTHSQTYSWLWNSTYWLFAACCYCVHVDVESTSLFAFACSVIRNLSSLQAILGGKSFCKTSSQVGIDPQEAQKHGRWKKIEEELLYHTMEQWQKRKTRTLPYICCPCRKYKEVIMSFFASIIP